MLFYVEWLSTILSVNVSTSLLLWMLCAKIYVKMSCSLPIFSYLTACHTSGCIAIVACTCDMCIWIINFTQYSIHPGLLCDVCRFISGVQAIRLLTKRHLSNEQQTTFMRQPSSWRSGKRPTSLAEISTLPGIRSILLQPEHTIYNVNLTSKARYHEPICVNISAPIDGWNDNCPSSCNEPGALKWGTGKCGTNYVKFEGPRNAVLENAGVKMSDWETRTVKMSERNTLF